MPTSDRGHFFTPKNLASSRLAPYTLVYMDMQLLGLILAPATLVLILLVWVIALHLRVQKLTRGGTGDSLEKILQNILLDYKKITGEHAELIQKNLILTEQSNASMQGLGFVRFNPFQDTGSKQSFALALLDRNGNGILISTLSTRERMSVFGKDIHSFTVTQELSTEEQQALDMAKKSLR